VHARRYFFDARLSDPERAHEALARIRALYAVEADAKARDVTGAALAAHRQQHAAPVLAAFADWLAGQAPRVLPKSTIGEAVTYAANQWPSLVVYTRDGRLTIDNSPAEQAIRPLAVGRRYAQFRAMRSCRQSASSSWPRSPHSCLRSPDPNSA
jgi:transposase